MNQDEVRKANKLFNESSGYELYKFIKPFLEKNDPYALYFSSCFSLSEWNESAEDFDQRNLDLLTKSAAANVPPALYRLSSLYLTGDTVEMDMEIGKIYLERALALGFGPAKLTVGVNLYHGANGYPQDVEKGLELIIDADKNGVEGAASALEHIKNS